VLRGILYPDAALLSQFPLIYRRIGFIPGKAIYFVSNHNVKRLAFCVCEHLLKFRPLIRLSCQGLVGVNLGEDITLIFYIVFAETHLGIDRQITLIIA
jgi:hypothetical protein